MRARSRPIFKVRKRRCGELALYVCARHKVRPRICVLISPAGPRSARYYCSNKDALFVLADAQSQRYTHTLYNITSDIFYEKYSVNHVCRSQICVGAYFGVCNVIYNIVVFILATFSTRTDMRIITHDMHRVFWGYDYIVVLGARLRPASVCAYSPRRAWSSAVW